MIDLIIKAVIIYLSYTFLGNFWAWILGFICFDMYGSLIGYLLIHFFGYMWGLISFVIYIVILAAIRGNSQTSNEQQTYDGNGNVCTNTFRKVNRYITPDVLSLFTVKTLRDYAKAEGITKLGRTKDEICYNLSKEINRK